MKHKLMNALIVICLALAHPSFLQTGSSHSLLPPVSSAEQAKDVCGDATYTVENPTEAPASLTIIEAGCDGQYSWKGQLDLKNTGDRLIRGYKVAVTSTYEHKKNVRDWYGRRGSELKPSDSWKIPTGAGVRDGLSYGKPVGRLQKVVFRIEHVEFSDGTIWEPNNSKSSE